MTISAADRLGGQPQEFLSTFAPPVQEAESNKGASGLSESDDVRMGVLDVLVPRYLTVKVENGWVTMSGMVDLPYQRSLAESHASNVPGVVRVINRIRLEGQETPLRPQARSEPKDD